LIELRFADDAAIMAPTSMFEDGYTHNEIQSFLEYRHGVILTPDQLRKRLQDMGLRR